VLTLCLVIAVALAFDFTNGFHDAANAIATSVTTRCISPRPAVILAGLLNFAGAFASIKVASTIGKGIINPGEITLAMIMAGLAGAICWNLVTWWLGLPSSSSHALVGGVAGAAIAGSGSIDVVQWSGVYHKVIVPSAVAPVLGFGLAAVLVLLLGGAVRRTLERRQARPLKGLQLLSAGFVAFTHGTNDAQKTMGVIALALVVYNGGDFNVPTWVKVSAALAMALGTYAGGWRIVRTLGSKVSTLDLRSGTAAQTAAGLVLYSTASYGYPVSTTQTITGSILGSGAATRFRTTRWSVGGRIAIAWLVTMPAAALVGAAWAFVLDLPGGQVVVAAALVAGVVVAWLRRRAFFGGWEQLQPTEPDTSALPAAPEPAAPATGSAAPAPAPLATAG
jgi:PiT family inorganic phosphate transporter